MIWAYLMLAAGGFLLGGAFSFYRSRHPKWVWLILGFLGLLCSAVSLWRIFAGG